MGILAAAAAVPLTASGSAARTLHLGDAFKVSGQAGANHGRQPATGTVVVLGKWGNGPFYLLRTTRTDGQGRYSFSVKPSRRGVLTLRITPPDKQSQQFVLHIL